MFWCVIGLFVALLLALVGVKVGKRIFRHIKRKRDKAVVFEKVDTDLYVDKKIESSVDFNLMKGSIDNNIKRDNLYEQMLRDDYIKSSDTHYNDECFNSEKISNQECISDDEYTDINSKVSEYKSLIPKDLIDFDAINKENDMKNKNDFSTFLREHSYSQYVDVNKLSSLVKDLPPKTKMLLASGIYSRPNFDRFDCGDDTN